MIAAPRPTEPACTTLAAAGPNAEQITYWNEQAARNWVTREALLDEQIAPLGLAAMERAGVAAGERVLDVGCGCGQTTLELAARVGPRGSVTGIDISTPMLERARERAAERGLAGDPVLERRRPVDDARPGVLRSRLQPLRRDVLRRPEGGLREPARQPRARGARLLRVLAGAGAQRLDERAAARGGAAGRAARRRRRPARRGPISFADPGRVRGILEGAGLLRDRDRAAGGHAGGRRRRGVARAGRRVRAPDGADGQRPCARRPPTRSRASPPPCARRSLPTRRRRA